ncbi:MAG: ABC transporter substrate-binding protein [Candidatus Dormibacteraceae bacterium]
MRTSTWRRRAGPVGALLAVLLLIAACGGTSNQTNNSASVPGVTKTSILVGTTTPLTGPAAPGYDEIAPAVKAYFKYVNDHGGVYGRKLTYDILDDQYNPSLTATKTRQLVLQDNIFAMLGQLGTPTGLAVAPFLNQEKIPDLFIESGCACWSQPQKWPQLFGWQPNYIVEGKILGKYIKDHLAGQKVGYLYQDDEFGQDGVKGLNMQVPASEVVAHQTYSTTTLTSGLGNQVAALKASGATVVALYTIPAATALTLLAAAEIGYHPIWVVSSVGSDPPTLTGLLSSLSKGKAGAELLNGMISNAYLPPESAATNPWVVFLKGILNRYEPGASWDGNSEYGLVLGATFVNLLKANGRDLTRQSLVKTLESKGRTLKTPGLIPLEFSATNHYGYMGSQLARIENGQIQAFGPRYVTTNNGPIKTYNGPEASPPSG